MVENYTPITNPINQPKAVKEQPSRVSYYLIIGAVVLVFGGILLFLFLRNKDGEKKTEINSSENISLPARTTVKKKKGGLILKTTDGAVAKKMGEAFTVDVVLNQPQNQITSYDLILQFDKSKIDLVQTTPIIKGFSFVPIDDPDGVVISAFKAPNSKFIHNIDEVELLTVTFKPKVKGSVTIAVAKEKGKRSTKFVNNQSAVYYPEVSQIELSIE